MMLNHLAEQVRLPDGTTVALGGEERAARPLELHGAEHLRRVPPGAGPAGVALRGRRRRPREARAACRTARTPSTSTTGSLAGDGPRAAAAAAVGPLPRRTRRPVSDAARRALHADRRRRPLRGRRRARDCPPLRLRLHGRARRRSPSSAATIAERALPGRGEPRLRRARRRCGARATSRCDLARGERGHAGRLDRAVGDRPGADARREALARRAERRRAPARTAPAPRRARRGRPPSWCWPPTSSSSRPPAASRTPPGPAPPATSVRTVIAGYHWFTDWGRDTMISLEGLTLTTGRHAEAGYILRTFAHYVRDGLIPNLFPEGENEGLYHTADATLWFFHAVDRYLATTGDRDTLRLLLPDARGHRRPPPARHAVRHRRRSRRRPAAAGGRGLPAHLDGRQGRRLGGDAAARQGGGDQRALVQRAAPAGAAGCAEERATAAAAELAAHAERAPRVVQRALLVRGRRLPLRRGRRRAAATTPALPAEPGLRHLAAAPGARPGALGGRCWTSVQRAAADARSACARWRPGHPDYKREVLRRPARARRRLPPGHGLGLADRPVRRRLAEGASRTTAPARGASWTGFVAAPRRGAASASISEIFDAEAPFTPARLRRPGLERGRGAAVLGEDAASGRSGNQSSVNSSIPFLTAPTMGSASRAVCARPPKSPLRFTEWAR